MEPVNHLVTNYNINYIINYKLVINSCKIIENMQRNVVYNK